VANGSGGGARRWLVVGAALTLVALVVAFVVLRDTGHDAGKPAAGDSPTSTEQLPSPSVTETPTTISPTVSATPSTVAPQSLPSALLHLSDLRAIPAQQDTAWNGATGWVESTRPRATWTCAPHLVGSAEAAFDDATFAQHRDGVDHEAATYPDPSAAHAALLGLRRTMGACASASAAVDLFAVFTVSGVGDESVLLYLSVPGQPPTYAAGDSGSHLIEVYVTRRAAALSVVSYGHNNQDLPYPATSFATATARLLCAATGPVCSPKPVLRQTFGDPIRSG
jgi:hypothetical protein